MLKSLFEVRNWRIGVKIFAGFGSIIILLALLSVLAVHELSATGASVARLNTASEAVQRILEIDRNMEVMRQQALRFKQLHAKASVDEFNESYKESIDLLTEAKKYAPSEDRLRLYNDAAQKIEVAKKKFDDLGKGVAVLLQAQDQFSLAGNKLNSTAHRVFALAEIGNNADTMLAVRDIEVALDIMRATVWRFQVTLDPKDMSSFKANVQNLNATVETFGQVANAQAKAPLGELTAAVKSYDETFTAVAKALLANEDLYSNEIRPVLADVYKMTNDAKVSILDNAQVYKKAADDSVSTGTMFTAAMAAGTMIVGILFAWFIGRGISRPLRKTAEVLSDLTNDRIVDVPYTARGDEIGAIAKATEVFKQSIAQKVVNFRVRCALDVVRSGVMLADDDYKILYMNGALAEIMKECAPELRKVTPDFDPDKVVGGTMDLFHKNPSHQRKVLDGLTGPHQTQISAGNAKISLTVTPVIDQHGQRSGTVVEWRNVTMEKAIEAEVDAVVKAAVAGDFSRRLPLEGKKEFMLNLATAMNSLCENTANALEDLIGMLSALAEGDLTARITADYHGAFGRLKSDANTMAERIGSTIAEIKSSAREVTDASVEISTSTSDLSQRTEEQAASLEQTSASMEQIATTVKRNAENAQQANQSAGSTREVADRGGQVVAKAVEAMARIEESSRKISDIITVIDEIARQTNLLALNAAVEAARAGEAGRGFAVVASEVRSLAQRSSQAAKDIKDLITSSNSQVRDGVDLVNKAGSALTEIVESIKKVAEIVSGIAVASAQQSTGIAQVNKALNQMDEVTQQNSALVEENAATAKTLEHQARAMDERVAFFRVAAGAEDMLVAAQTRRPAARMTPGLAPAGPPKSLAARAVKSAAPNSAEPKPLAPPPAAASKSLAAAGAGRSAGAVRIKAAAAGAVGRGSPVARMQETIAEAMLDPEWKEF
ncbi:MAG TPA: methyl-accepting chemotaxis protein [Xanthobacteraceae bacterium]|nr:methyl-accepting chemotaxis protein [Xanthobacteraceae bacterium]